MVELEVREAVRLCVYNKVVDISGMNQTLLVMGPTLAYLLCLGSLAVDKRCKRCSNALWSHNCLIRNQGILVERGSWKSKITSVR